MIKQLISIAIYRPISIIMILLGISFFGIFSLRSLPQEFLPNIKIPQITISTTFPSASPQEIRKLITIPLEEGLSSVTGLKNISSVSRKSTSTITLSFEWGTDMLQAAVETRAVIDNQYQALPNAANKPIVLPVSSQTSPLVIVTIKPKVDSNLYQLRRNANKEIKTELQQIKGVGSVVLVGGTEQEIQVEVDINKLFEKQLSIEQLSSLIAERNISYPVGTFIDGSREFLVKTNAELKSIDELKTIKFPSVSNDSFALQSISSISMAEREQESLFNYNGHEVIALLVYSQQGNHSIAVTKQLQQKIAELSDQYPDYSFDIAFDASKEIISNVNGVLYSLALGALAAFLVTLVMLKNLKTAAMLIIALPFSLFITFIVLRIFNISLNVLSLSGLSISIGMLIDNSVVVLENINTKIKSITSNTNIKQTYIESTHEMAKSTFNSTITSIIVFLPLVFLPGILGKLYQDLAITISCSLLASFFVAITVVPICYLFLFPNPQVNNSIKESIPFQKRYASLLSFFIKQPKVMWLALLGLLSTLVFFSIININLFPDSSEKQVNVLVEFPPNTSITYISKVAKEQSLLLLSDTRITKIFSRAGGEAEDIFYWANPYEKRENLYLTIYYQNDNFNNIKQLINENFNNTNASLEIEKPVNKIGVLLGLNHSVSSYSYKIEEIDTIEEEKNILQASLPKNVFSNIHITPGNFSPQLVVYPKREPLVRTNNSPQTLSQAINTAVFGAYSGKITIDEYDYNVRIRIP